ncbi:cytochrome c biogenesis CcdA family protein [Ancylobacter dichloromethanicus]|uniref:Cytochrome C biogenesis protein CcdA n=1 Tax=Ancylobacter dichloromethanicus TaxID=518825 RepID=A0A9W6MXK2_9HYPH|nr:cytochrome c biogenesis protein CcdA [Ancylobacter dichloromethanicus]GLK70659.1 cytochrome C biogenesis protein CcdA [Ancylobacter dichloromethanicus]
MTFPIGGIGFGFLAGMLSTLSPCVLPLLPLVLGPAIAAHRLGVPALAAGLVTSFVAVGLFVATIGFSIGLDGGIFRSVSAVLLVLMGIVLLSDALQQRFAMAAGGISNAGNQLIARFSPSGLSGQFVLGLLLGAIWSPCVGPTLGAASLLAAQGRDLASVAIVMVAFGLGTAIPLLIVGSLSRQALSRWRGNLMGVGKLGKVILGVGALAVAAMILSGFDRTLEAALVAASPTWLVDLTTRY